MATFYDETKDEIKVENLSRGNGREKVSFTLLGAKKTYHVTVEGDAQIETTVEESELPEETES